MSDRQKSTVTPTPSAATALSSERHPTFRHTFLAHLPPDVAEALEHLGRGLYHLVLALPGEPHHRSWTAARLQATAADLHFQATYLRELARERQASSLPETDGCLSDRAQAWADQAQALATRIESALS
jgi:hypothetical protein